MGDLSIKIVILLIPLLVGTLCVFGYFSGYGLTTIFRIQLFMDPPRLIGPIKSTKDQKLNLLTLGIILYIYALIVFFFINGFWIMKTFNKSDLNSKQIEVVKELDQSGIRLKND